MPPRLSPVSATAHFFSHGGDTPNKGGFLIWLTRAPRVAVKLHTSSQFLFVWELPQTRHEVVYFYFVNQVVLDMHYEHLQSVSKVIWNHTPCSRSIKESVVQAEALVATLAHLLLSVSVVPQLCSL